MLLDTIPQIRSRVALLADQPHSGETTEDRQCKAERHEWPDQVKPLCHAAPQMNLQ